MDDNKVKMYEVSRGHKSQNTASTAASATVTTYYYHSPTRTLAINIRGR